MGKGKEDIKDIPNHESVPNKERLHDVFIERVTNGYILYENENLFGRNYQSVSKVERKVFETKSALFEFLQHNF